MMMILGPLVFSVTVPAYEQLQRNTQYQWASQGRLGIPVLRRLGIGGPAYQYIGPGEDSINLNGTFFPQYKGSPGHVSLMRVMAGLGVPLPLIDVNGLIFGLWLIESIQETKSAFLSDGASRKIDFSLTLKRYENLIPI